VSTTVSTATAGPAAAVVFATHNRAERLAALLGSLRAQDIDLPFEVVVVDDGSDDATPAVLAEELLRGDLDLHVLSHDTARGPAAARNAGWRAARAPFVAFTDDDCVVVPGWLRTLHETWAQDLARVVQGQVLPNPAEADREGPFSRSLRVASLGPFFQTANVAYARELLERVGGFDEETFSVPGGEDVDLAHRCFATGARPVFAAEALALHAVHTLGPMGKLRVAWRWHETVRVYVRHPAMRSTLTYRIFWKKTHFLLIRALVGLLLPRRLRQLRYWCFAPIVPAYWERAGSEGHGARWSAPYFLLHDIVELVAIVRGAARYRTLML
jgi:glycosyltransferase involved in cell wall biosynthesis